jgi:hypothetical protein
LLKEARLQVRSDDNVEIESAHQTGAYQAAHNLDMFYRIGKHQPAATQPFQRVVMGCRKGPGRPQEGFENETVARITEHHVPR